MQSPEMEMRIHNLECQLEHKTMHIGDLEEDIRQLTLRLSSLENELHENYDAARGLHATLPNSVAPGDASKEGT